MDILKQQIENYINTGLPETFNLSLLDQLKTLNSDEYKEISNLITLYNHGNEGSKKYIFNQEVKNEIISLQFIPEVGDELGSLSKTSMKLKSLINKLQNNYKNEHIDTLYTTLNTFKTFNSL